MWSFIETVAGSPRLRFGRTQCIMPKCRILHFSSSSVTQNGVSKLQHKLRHLLKPSFTTDLAALSADARGKPPLWARQPPPPPISLSHAHKSLGTLSSHLLHSVEPA